MKTLASALVLAALITAPDALAQGKKRASEVGYTREAAENTLTGLENSLDRVAKARQADIAEFDRAAADYQVRVSAADELREKARLADQNDELYKVHVQRAQVIAQEVEALKSKAAIGKLTPSDKDDLKLKEVQLSDRRKELADAAQNAERAKVALADAEKRLGKLNDRFSSYAKSTGVENPTLAQLHDQLHVDRGMEDAERVTRGLFDKVSKDYMDTKLLLMDFDHLKTKYELVGANLEAVKKVAGEKLGNTVLGDYIQKQVRDAMVASCTDQTLREVCAAGDANAIDGVLKSLQGKPSPERAQSDTRRRRGRAPAGVDAPITPAGAPIAQ